jgi:hypothetical protein
MRMQKEEKIVVVLLLMALGSLAVAFWAFSPEGSPQDSSYDSLFQKDAGTSLSVDGLVLEIKPTKSGSNLILILDATKLPIFIPAKAGAKELQSRIKAGNRVSIRGTVSTFQGIEELVVSRQGDIQVLTA